MEPRRGLAEPFACGIAGTQRRECLGSWLLSGWFGVRSSECDVGRGNVRGVSSDGTRKCHGDGDEVGPNASSAEQGSGR